MFVVYLFLITRGNSGMKTIKWDGAFLFVEKLCFDNRYHFLMECTYISKIKLVGFGIIFGAPKTLHDMLTVKNTYI